MPQASRTRDEAREADAPDNPTELPKRSWPQILKRTGQQFSEDKLTTWAAALTYYAVLSIFPALLALVSILGLIGNSATQPLLNNLNSIDVNRITNGGTLVAALLNGNLVDTGVGPAVGIALQIDGVHCCLTLVMIVCGG